MAEGDKLAGDQGAADKGGADKGAVGDKGAANKGAAVDKGADDKGSGTLIDAGGDKGAGDQGDKGANKTATTTEWRDKLAGGDAAFRKRLDRFSDEATFAKSYLALEQKLKSGEYKRAALPDGATDEEKAAWRKESGLPEKAEGYVEALALPEGMVLGEADKPIVAEFAKAAFDSNVDPKAFSGLVAQYYKIQDAQKAAQEEADVAFKQTSEDDLRTEWKGDYRRNLASIKSMMSTWPEGLAVRVLAGRTPDGRKLGDDPAFVRQLAALAAEINPLSTVTPAGGGSVSDRLAEIRKFRQENPDGYDRDHKMQAEELTLIDAELKAKARNAA